MKGPWEIGSDAGAKLSTLSARKQGAIMFAVGIVVLLIDAAMIFGSDHYYRMLLFLGIGLPPLSLWVMVTGRAGTRNEPKAPIWWWIGTVIVLVITVAAAVGAMMFLEG